MKEVKSLAEGSVPELGVPTTSERRRAIDGNGGNEKSARTVKKRFERRGKGQ
jgi:hypothetical protein